LYIFEVNYRDELMIAVNNNEIYPGVHYRDNTEYSMYSYGKGNCPNAHRLSKRILSLPMHMRLTKKDINDISLRVIKSASSVKEG
jgi:dTDP-4-amino-4,6-dideoxygalactose transaminase